MSRFFRKFCKENRKIVMQAAWEYSGAILETAERVQIEIKPLTRNLEQNAKLHAMLEDIALQKTFNGKKLSSQQWKVLFVSAHAIATQGEQPEMVQGLEGEMVNLRESTAKMSVKRCASLIEYIQAWSVENTVKLKG